MCSGMMRRMVVVMMGRERRAFLGRLRLWTRRRVAIFRGHWKNWKLLKPGTQAGYPWVLVALVTK